MNIAALRQRHPPKRQSKMSLKKAIKDVFDRTWTEVDAQLSTYGATRENLGMNHMEKMDRILDADDVMVAEELSKKARMSIFFSLLRQWGDRKITPNTIDALEKRAKSAESFAKWREKEGDLEAAERQRQRAAELQAAADKLRAKEVVQMPDFATMPKEDSAPPKAEKKAKLPKKPSKRRKK